MHERGGVPRSGVLVALVLVLCAGISMPASAASTTPTSITPQLEIDQAIQFRNEYGLDSNPATVARYAADDALSRSYGVPLTVSEEQELRRRDAITASLDPLVAELEKQPSYAGIYFDQAAGGVIDIATTDDPARMADLAKLAPVGAEVRIRMVQYTTHELEALQASVTSDWQAWRDSGVNLASIGIDVKANLLRVSVVDLSQDVKGRIEAKYGPALDVVLGEEVQAGACASRTNCAAPLKGGLSITGGGWVCTSGFGGKLDSTGSLRLITAGHCLKNSGAVTWSHNGVAIGKALVHYYYSNSTADAGLIAWSESGARNRVYASSHLDILSSMTNATQVVGATVCRSGKSSGWRCGTIASTNVDTSVSGVLILHMWWTNYPSTGGDSGGPMMDNGTKAMGIFSAYTSTQSVYSTITWITDASGVRPCYTTTC